MDFSKLTAYLDSLNARYGVPGFDIKITKDHETIYRHSGGCRDYEKTQPVTDQDLYYIYSATKVITMTAAMQLIEQGKMKLDDPVSNYLPEFRAMRVADHYVIGQWPPVLPKQDDPCHDASTPITLRMLMSMTSGLSYDIGSEPIRALRDKTDGRATTREMMGAIAQMPLLFEPGSHYTYSLGHDVIAGVIEVVSGKTYGQYLKDSLFDPLGIRDMYFQVDDALRPRLTAQYTGVMGSDEIRPVEQKNAYRLTDRYESGGAGIACTVDAYSAVIDALANGGVGKTGRRILTPDGIAALAVNQLRTEILPEYQAPWRMEYGYGLGVRTLIHPEDSPTPQGEFGWDGAAGAYALIDPVNHVSIFYTQEILGMIKVYSEIHPMLRNLAYEALP
ncbi:MAG: beta-lactamase family protein [Clostridia bacterium]|nr:beta-lactamase family protein [Clostridia bacterium]